MFSARDRKTAPEAGALPNLLATRLTSLPGQSTRGSGRFARRERSDVRLVVQRRHPGILVTGEMGNIQDERTFALLLGITTLPSLLPLSAFSRLSSFSLLLVVAAVTFDAGMVEMGLMSVA